MEIDVQPATLVSTTSAVKPVLKIVRTVPLRVTVTNVFLNFITKMIPSNVCHLLIVIFPPYKPMAQSSVSPALMVILKQQ